MFFFLFSRFFHISLPLNVIFFTKSRGARTGKTTKRQANYNLWGRPFVYVVVVVVVVFVVVVVVMSKQN